MLPKPSLVLQVRLRPEEYSDTAAAEIKRSYMYLAQSVVSELDEGEPRARGQPHASERPPHEALLGCV